MPSFFKNRRIQSASTGVVIPTGSAAQRPDDPVFGMIRYNTDTGFCEFYNGTVWQNFGTGGTVSYTVDNFTGTGPWTWDCVGLNGGTTEEDCTASLASSVLFYNSRFLFNGSL
jgi:hypothetical protein